MNPRGRARRAGSNEKSPPSRAGPLATRWSHFAVWALLCTVVSLGLWTSNWRWSAFLDNAALDGLFALRGAHSPAQVAESLPQSRDIIIVELTHDTPRDILAQLLPKLKRARVVGLDLMFSDQTAPLSRDELPLYREEIARWKREDAALSQAISNAGNVVVGAWSDTIVPQNGSSTRHIRWNLPVASLAHGAQLSHLSVLADPQDGIVRRVQLFARIRGRSVPAFGLAMAAHARNVSVQKLAWQSDGKLSLPLDSASAGASFVNYLGPRAIFEYPTNRIVFERALDAEPEDFAGKIVLVGQTDARSKDIFPTPFGDMPGLFIHANLIATLLDAEGPPRSLAPLWTGAILLGLALLLVASLARFPMWMCAPIALMEILVVLGLAALLFSFSNQILPLSVPVGTLVFTYNGVALYEYRRARRTLGRVVGHQVSAQLLDAFTSPDLGGKLQVATAFFCDLRGYSTFSEHLSPEALISLLNLYTEAVVREVLKFGGRPIDFFCDGVFVLFEAAPGKNHARQAVQAALATLRAVAAQMQGLQSATAFDPARRAAANTPRFSVFQSRSAASQLRAQWARLRTGTQPHFSNASFLELGVFQQGGREGIRDFERLTRFRFRGVRARYEAIVSPRVTAFVSGDYNAARSVVDSGGAAPPVEETLSNVPRVRLESGVQFLSNQGLFVQPSLGYFGEVAAVRDFVTPRAAASHWRTCASASAAVVKVCFIWKRATFSTARLWFRPSTLAAISKWGGRS